MPRIGTSTEHQRPAGSSKFAFAPGFGLITRGRCAVEKIGERFTATGIRVTVQRVDEKTLKPTDDEEVTQFLPLGNVNTRDGDPLITPCEAKSADDMDPKVLEGEDDVEGTAVYAHRDDFKFDESLGGAVFSKSLQDLGFPVAMLNGYFPNLEGIIAQWDQKPLREKKAGDEKDRPPTALVAKKILQFPNGVNGGAKGAGSGAAKGGAAKPAAAAAAAPAASAGEPSAELDDVATQVVVAIAEKLAGQTATRAKINTQVTVTMGKLKVPAAQHKAVKELVANDEWFLAKAGELDWTIQDDGSVTFAAA